MIRIRKQSVIYLLPTVFLYFFLTVTGCGFMNGGTEAGNPDDEKVEVKTFTNNDDLRDYIVDQYARSFLPESAYGDLRWDDSDTDVGQESPSDDSGNTDSTEKSDDYSDTNLQEKDVDESDKVKTDGDFFYIAGDDSISIVDIRQNETPLLSATYKVNGSVDSLYLYENTLVVLYIPQDSDSSPWSSAYRDTSAVNVGFPYWLNVNSELGVLFLDITDPQNPAKRSEKIIEGELVSSRIIHGKLYIVQQFLSELPAITYICGTNDNEDEIYQSNKTLLSDVAITDLIPFYKDIDENGNESEKKQLVLPANFYVPSKSSGGSVVTTTTINLSDLTAEPESTGIVADAHYMYASTKAIYIASTRWAGYSYGEKSSDNLDDTYQTYLYKLSIEEDPVLFSGTGIISGHVLNQFSFGEYEDVLRVATTTGEVWSGTSSNHIYCIKAVNEELKIIGQINDIAKGEKIYAARFIGKRGFIVTFVKVDPLFTLDLSDPENPQIVGELKIPGYSDYIHPLGENHLLTIGKHAEPYYNTAYYQGIQLSIFDITDFSNPTLLYKEIIGDRGTDSEALRNHKAFEYWAAKGLLAIPVHLYQHDSPPVYPYEYADYQYSGLFVYEISTETGFSKLGEITNTDSLYTIYQYDWARGKFNGDYVYYVLKDSLAGASLTEMENQFQLSWSESSASEEDGAASGE